MSVGTDPIVHSADPAGAGLFSAALSSDLSFKTVLLKEVFRICVIGNLLLCLHPDHRGFGSKR